jgi:hypothetical protein
MVLPHLHLSGNRICPGAGAQSTPDRDTVVLSDMVKSRHLVISQTSVQVLQWLIVWPWPITHSFWASLSLFVKMEMVIPVSWAGHEDNMRECVNKPIVETTENKCSRPGDTMFSSHWTTWRRMERKGKAQLYRYRSIGVWSWSWTRWQTLKAQDRLSSFKTPEASGTITGPVYMRHHGGLSDWVLLLRDAQVHEMWNVACTDIILIRLRHFQGMLPSLHWNHPAVNSWHYNDIAEGTPWEITAYFLSDSSFTCRSRTCCFALQHLAIDMIP